MTIKQHRAHFNKSLKHLYPTSEIDSFFFLILEEYMGLKRIDIVLKSDFLIDKKSLNLMQIATKQLEQEIPIQYIIGKTEFFGLPFHVNKEVLIPRPETEELVEQVIKEVSLIKTCKTASNEATNEKQITILDIGTGSGCIAISLKKQLPGSKISAIDVSDKALRVAKKNAALNKVDINFIHLDILKTNNLDKLYYKNYKNLSIEFFSRPNIRPENLQLEMLKKVSTKYTIVCADDDIILENSIIKCIDFLETNSDYISATGRIHGFASKKDKSKNCKVYVWDEYSQKNITQK